MPNYYKAVPKRFVGLIRTQGLDPRKAGQPGGATALAKTKVARDATDFDTNYTWLGTRSQAERYAESVFDGQDPIILKIVLSEGFARVAVDNCGDSGFGTRSLIPPAYLYFQTAKGDYWAHIATYTGPNAYVFGDDDAAVDDAEFD
jgi:hypothetical protein